MFDILKKLGVPATVALVVSALITVVPIIFGIDKRYAKTEEVSTQVEKLQRQVLDLTTEIGKIAGAQETLLDILMQQERQRTRSVDDRPRLSLSSPAEASTPPTSPAPLALPAPARPVPSSPPRSGLPEEAPRNITRQLEDVRSQVLDAAKNIEQIKKY